MILSLKEIQKVLEANSKDISTKAIFLLTDGCPNVSPTRGEVYTLQKTIEKDFNNKLPCIINTYGFGYSLDSKLLNALANCGHGSFSFIPDAGMVGTIFVNSISNIMSSYASNLKVYIEFEENDKTGKDDSSSSGDFRELIKEYSCQEVDENNIVITIGNIFYGQPINLLLNGPRYGNRNISACKIEYFGCESEFNQTFTLDDINQRHEERNDEAMTASTTTNEVDMLQNLSLKMESHIK